MFGVVAYNTMAEKEGREMIRKKTKIKMAFTISENLNVFRASVWTSKPVLRTTVQLSSAAACMHVPQPGAKKEILQGESRGDRGSAGPKEWEEVLRQDSELASSSRKPSWFCRGKRNFHCRMT